jgi:hypothetical protein
MYTIGLIHGNIMNYNVVKLIYAKDMFLRFRMSGSLANLHRKTLIFYGSAIFQRDIQSLSSLLLSDEPLRPSFSFWVFVFLRTCDGKD